MPPPCRRSGRCPARPCPPPKPATAPAPGPWRCPRPPASRPRCDRVRCPAGAAPARRAEAPRCSPPTAPDRRRRPTPSTSRESPPAPSRGRSPRRSAPGARNRDAPHREQVLPGEMQSDAEHQQDHADFRQLPGQRLIGDEPRRVGTDHQSRQQITHQRRYPQPRRDRAEQKGKADADDDGGDQGGVMGHERFPAAGEGKTFHRVGDIPRPAQPSIRIFRRIRGPGERRECARRSPPEPSRPEPGRRPRRVARRNGRTSPRRRKRRR